MGLEHSKPLKEWQCEAVAASIADFGQQYALYSDSVIENFVDGNLLVAFALSGSPEIEETLSGSSMQKARYRRVIQQELLKLVSSSSYVVDERKGVDYYIDKRGIQIIDSRDEYDEASSDKRGIQIIDSRDEYDGASLGSSSKFSSCANGQQVKADGALTI